MENSIIFIVIAITIMEKIGKNSVSNSKKSLLAVQLFGGIAPIMFLFDVSLHPHLDTVSQLFYWILFIISYLTLFLMYIQYKKKGFISKPLIILGKILTWFLIIIFLLWLLVLNQHMLAGHPGLK